MMNYKDSDLPGYSMTSNTGDSRQRHSSSDGGRRHSLPTDSVHYHSEIDDSSKKHAKDIADFDTSKGSNGSRKFSNPLTKLVEFGRPRSRSDAGQNKEQIVSVDKSSPLYVATSTLSTRVEQPSGLTVIYQGQQLEMSPPISPSSPSNIANNSTSKSNKKRSKSPNGFINRFRHRSGQYSPASSPTSPTGVVLKSTNKTSPKEVDPRNNPTVMPDPTKLPKESPCSSLEFTQDPLKAQRYRKMSYPFASVNPEKFVPDTSCDSNCSRSVEMLLTDDPLDRIISLAPTPGSDLNTAITAKNFGVKRVSENKRFIMFSKSPLRASDDYLEEGCDYLGTTDVFSTFFQHSSCYDLIPDSAKLVVLASNLQVGRAFRALLYNGVRAAPIWSDQHQSFVGMLTISDFIKILNHYIKNNRDIDDNFENQTIDSWREVTHNSTRDFFYLSPENSLYSAVDCLRRFKVHRLPVIDLRSGNALYIVTHKRLLKYLYVRRHELPLPQMLNETLGSLSEVGTFTEIITIRPDQTLKEVLPLFCRYRVSALPVVSNDESQRLTGIFAKFDTIHLASTGSYKNLNMTVAEALSYKKSSPLHSTVCTCMKSDTLKSIIDKIVINEVHRLVVVDSPESSRVIGIISLSDLLNFLILKVAKNGSLAETLFDSSSRSTINSTQLTSLSNTSRSSLDSGRSTKCQLLKTSQSLPEGSHSKLQEDEEELFKMEMA